MGLCHIGCHTMRYRVDKNLLKKEWRLVLIGISALILFILISFLSSCERPQECPVDKAKSECS